MISVALIVKNGENFILEFLKSIDRQDISTLELIYVDGGSTDKTKMIFEEFKFQKNVDQIFIDNANEKNIVESYNLALNAASYKYLAIPGVDDCYLDYRWLSRCVEFLELNDTYDMVFGRSIIVDEDHSFKLKTANMPFNYNISNDQFLHFISRLFMPIDVNMVVKTDIIRKCFPIHTSEKECDIFVPHLTFFKNFFSSTYRCFFMNVLATYSITPAEYHSRRQIKYKDRENKCMNSIFGVLNFLRSGRKAKFTTYMMFCVMRFWRIQSARLCRIVGSHQ